MGNSSAAHRDKLRVLIVSNFFPPYVVGGAEMVAFHLAVWLKNIGVEVRVVSTCGPDKGESEELIDGVRVLRYFPRNLWWNIERFAPGDRRSRAAKLLWNIRDLWNRDSARRFGRILDEVQPDLVHTHNIKGMSPPVIWREVSRRHAALIHTAHDYYLLCQRGTMTNRNDEMCKGRCTVCRLATSWPQICVRRTDLICFNSHFLLDRHQSFGISGRYGGIMVPNGVPDAPGRRLERRVGRSLRLLFLGQLCRQKGAHLLAGALGALGPDVRLSIAGDGALAPAIAKLAERDRRVVAHGFVGGDAKERLFAESDALLFPSIWSESAPLSIAEAMMRGLPVIGSNLGAIPEFVQNERNGLLFPAGDSAALAGAIQRLSAQDGLLEELSAGAVGSAQKWSVEAMGRRYLQAYNDIRSKRLEPARVGP